MRSRLLRLTAALALCVACPASAQPAPESFDPTPAPATPRALPGDFGAAMALDVSGGKTRRAGEKDEHASQASASFSAEASAPAFFGLVVSVGVDGFAPIAQSGDEDDDDHRAAATFHLAISTAIEAWRFSVAGEYGVAASEFRHLARDLPRGERALSAEAAYVIEFDDAAVSPALAIGRGADCCERYVYAAPSLTLNADLSERWHFESRIGHEHVRFDDADGRVDDALEAVLSLERDLGGGVFANGGVALLRQWSTDPAEDFAALTTFLSLRWVF